ncbi:hypothetical protein [Klebsiella quasipneumoniae]|jgi:hypothetical protein|uniref:hypothetical protein n=1 Tax=Klebsiella quasipneumoniae TaxID=1463165 RepID=UPI000F6644F3|nr:hypothetical protein [Klebsiella quasipneumoniae]ELA0753029.1 hypothetical protein [Klebsiella quasipneumoniae]ELA0824450.1 hypothetical protein [Klebsiella quasipneumoniae]MBG2329686.1 hypothetical protein [Klebsiella quasipneumoniae]MBG2371339.1 hypothetical protein [Klebsiella quasipneumoniae]MBG2436250.1 hypothetical protein [Klebsiella quasipneumoniae]
MIKRLIVSFSLIFCSSALAGQEVLTAYPSTGEFKFVWSGDSAVFKSQDGKVTVRCTFDQSLNGVDDAAEPYIGSSFLCNTGVTLILKQTSRNKASWLILMDKSGKVLNDVSVLIDRKSY